MTFPAQKKITAVRASLTLSLALLVLANVPQAQARSVFERRSMGICPAIAVSWRGTLEDRKQIDTVPVPRSFRELLYKDECTSWSLREGDLIAWNLSFGSERTTTAALTFLENFYTKELSASQRHGFFRNWRADLATFYLWAAEFYESPALLKRALVHVPLSQAQVQSTAAKSSPETARRDVSNNLTRDLALRAAVLKARLSRLPVDIDAAQARLDGHYVPVYRDAAEFARFNGVQRFCQHAERANREKIHDACNNGITNFENGLREFWLYQAQLDLLKAPLPRIYDRLPITDHMDDRSGSMFVKRDPGDTGVKIRLEIYNEIPSVRYARLFSRPFLNAHYSVAWFGPNNTNSSLQVRALDLGFLSAEFYARWADLPEYWANQRNYPQSKATYLKRAMLELEHLERYVPAARNPGRFRQIATRYLHYHDALTALPASARTPLDRRTVEPSNALYYQSVLEALEQIRTGDSAADNEAQEAQEAQ